MNGIHQGRIHVQVMTGNEYIRAPLILAGVDTELHCVLLKIQKSMQMIHKVVYELVEDRQQRKM